MSVPIYEQYCLQKSVDKDDLICVQPNEIITNSLISNEKNFKALRQGLSFGI